MPPPKMYTVDDLSAALPAGVKLKSTALRDMVSASGCYRAFGDNIIMLDEDIADFLASIRARPTEAEAQRRMGAARHMLPPPNAHARGFLVVIGDQLINDGAVFISWCPEGGVQELLDLVQFGNPEPMAVLMFVPATPDEVSAHTASLGQRARTDDTKWFARTTAVNTYLERLREAALGGDIEIEEDDE